MIQILFIPTDANSIQAWVSVAQLLLTLITIVLLLGNFAYQSFTLREQQVITKIELERMELERKRSKNAARPLFKIDYYSELQSEKRSVFRLKLNLMGNNPATHVIFNSNNDFCYDVPPQEIMNAGDLVIIPLTRPFENLYHDIAINIISFEYNDYLGNRYEQIVWLLRTEVELSPPYDAL